MFTPQQIEQISFSKATFGGYNMEDVDAFLEPLTDDYVTLYKENALLKSKMRVLVAKLEEYRQNEASMKDAIVNAQKTCDLMVKEAEAKCTQMLTDANAAAAENAKNAVALIAEENARVEEAKRAAAERISQIEEQMNACIQALQTQAYDVEPITFRSVSSLTIRQTAEVDWTLDGERAEGAEEIRIENLRRAFRLRHRQELL